jgi:hypothetical protein
MTKISGHFIFYHLCTRTVDLKTSLDKRIDKLRKEGSFNDSQGLLMYTPIAERTRTKNSQGAGLSLLEKA